MLVLVTGGTGSVGMEILSLLKAQGHTTRVVGRRDSGPGDVYVKCDVTDYAGLKRAMAGCQAVIHLAALATPFHGPDEEIFRLNCDGSFNVYHAASELGIRRVVSASSINAFGFHYGVRPFPLRYLPVDEEHPTSTTDPYSFSKQVLEEIADYYWRREGISGCCLRLPWVANATPDVRGPMGEYLRKDRRVLEEWIRLPPARGAAQAARIIAQAEVVRAKRMYEHPSTWDAVERLPEVGIMSSYTNLFVQVDARDSARAFERALVLPYEGSHALFINDSVNRYLLESRELARLFYPETTLRPSFEGCAAPVSCGRARDLLGWEPVHTMDRLGVHVAVSA